MFDFRYHIISLVAVFLALGVGIFMGTMVAEKGVVNEQERALIEKLEKDFDTLREENKVASERLKQADLFSKEMIPMAVHDKLFQQNVGIVITTNLDEEHLKDLKSTLQQAGANLRSTTSLTSELGFNKKENLDKINTILETSNLTGNQLKNKMMTDMGKQLVSGQNASFFQNLKDAGAIRIDGSYDTPLQIVLIVGGSDEENSVDNVDAPFIKQLAPLGTVMVGMESSTVKTSYMSAYQSLGISTVDNIDTAAGLVSCVFAADGQPGFYGTKSSAKRFMPVLFTR